MAGTKRKAEPATPAKTKRRRQLSPTAAAVSAETETEDDAGTDADTDVLGYLQRWSTEQKTMGKLKSLAAGQIEPRSEGTAAAHQADVDELEFCMQMREFITAYGVPRTFKGMRVDNVLPLLPLVTHLQRRWASGELERQQDGALVVLEVEALADVCKAAGYARNLSFASKCLNMLGLRVPLFSSECLAYLQLPRTCGFERFHEAWMGEFSQRREALEAAAVRHAEGYECSMNGVWLAMRALDVRMLAVGGPMRK